MGVTDRAFRPEGQCRVMQNSATVGRNFLFALNNMFNKVSAYMYIRGLYLATVVHAPCKIRCSILKKQLSPCVTVAWSVVCPFRSRADRIDNPLPRVTVSHYFSVPVLD